MSDAFINAKTITATNVIAGKHVVFNSELRRDPRELLALIGEEVQRNRESLPIADDLEDDVDRIRAELEGEHDEGRLRARLDRLAASAGSVTAVATAVGALRAALGV